MTASSLLFSSSSSSSSALLLSHLRGGEEIRKRTGKVKKGGENKEKEPRVERRGEEGWWMEIRRWGATEEDVPKMFTSSVFVSYFTKITKKHIVFSPLIDHPTGQMTDYLTSLLSKWPTYWITSQLTARLTVCHLKISLLFFSLCFKNDTVEIRCFFNISTLLSKFSKYRLTVFLFAVITSLSWHYSGNDLLMLNYTLWCLWTWIFQESISWSFSILTHRLFLLRGHFSSGGEKKGVLKNN